MTQVLGVHVFLGEGGTGLGLGAGRGSWPPLGGFAGYLHDSKVSEGHLWCFQPALGRCTELGLSIY